MVAKVQDIFRGLDSALLSKSRASVGMSRRLLQSRRRELTPQPRVYPSAAVGKPTSGCERACVANQCFWITICCRFVRQAS